MSVWTSEIFKILSAVFIWMNKIDSLNNNRFSIHYRQSEMWTRLLKLTSIWVQPKVQFHYMLKNESQFRNPRTKPDWSRTNRFGPQTGPGPKNEYWNRIAPESGNFEKSRTDLSKDQVHFENLGPIPAVLGSLSQSVKPEFLILVSGTISQLLLKITNQELPTENFIRLGSKWFLS